MLKIILNKGQMNFITHCLENDFRYDGRSLNDFRPIEMETGLISNSNGSARIRLDNTDVMAVVKSSIDKPTVKSPNCGKIEFFVACSPNASREFEGRGGEYLAKELAGTLKRAYESPFAFDLNALCILPGQHCWKLFVDILILEWGGNMYDAVSIATKAALFDARIPKVTSTLLNAAESILKVSDDVDDYTRLRIDNAPIIITVCKIGDSYALDPTLEEEQCITAGVVIAVSKRDNKQFISHVRNIGPGAISGNALCKCLTIGKLAAEKLNDILLQQLKVEQTRKIDENIKSAKFL